MISADAALQAALGFALDWGRGAEKIQIGAPTLAEAMEAYLARPKLRSEAHKHTKRLRCIVPYEAHLIAKFGLRSWITIDLARGG